MGLRSFMRAWGDSIEDARWAANMRRARHFRRTALKTAGQRTAFDAALEASGDVHFDDTATAAAPYTAFSRLLCVDIDDLCNAMLLSVMR